MGAQSNSLYTWSPVRHRSRLDSDIAHRRQLVRQRARVAEAGSATSQRGPFARLAHRLGHLPASA